MYKFLFSSPKVEKTGYIFKVRNSFDDRIKESILTVIQEAMGMDN